MSDGFRFEFSDITRLAADLGKQPAHAIPKIIVAVETTALAVKKDWQEPLAGSESLPGGAAAVTHELKGGASVLGSAVSAEIGPELRGQGPLVGMLEYGTPNTGARGYGAEALHRNEEKFAQAVVDAGEIVL